MALPKRRDRILAPWGWGTVWENDTVIVWDDKERESSDIKSSVLSELTSVTTWLLEGKVT